jgi:alpha-tubulin suppressor-like RCC1 family protein
MRPFLALVGVCASLSLAIACSGSDDGGGGAPDASPDEGVDVVTSDASGSADTSSVDAISGDGPGDVDATADAGSDASDAAYAFDGDAAVLGHQLGTGGAHSCAIRAGGAVRCWGSNSKGQLGNGASDGGSATPVDVVGLTDAVELAAGGEFTCARRVGGGVRCWGDGRELGVGPDAGAYSSVPVDVTGLVDAVQLAAGSYHACALRANRHVVCWGSNYGRIGDGTTGDRLTPTEPVGPTDAGTITDAISVGAGWGHTCIAHENGTVTCSGEYQPWGQLGDGTTADRYSPVLVQNMSTARAVGLGLYTSYALLASGQLQSWGNNQIGQLGIGTSDQAVHGSPVDVSGMTSVAELAPCGWGSCALTQTRQGYCWGDYVSTSMSPAVVTTSGPIAEISGGERHACARMISGEVQCWGSNDSRQLGAGVDAGGTSATPVTVPGL